MPSGPRSLNPAEQLDWLRLIRSENVGPVTFYQLLARYGSAAAALDALPELARRAGRRRPLALFSRAAAERELAQTRSPTGQARARSAPKVVATPLPPRKPSHGGKRWPSTTAMVATIMPDLTSVRAIALPLRAAFAGGLLAARTLVAAFATCQIAPAR